MREVFALCAMLMSPSCGSGSALEANERDLATAASIEQLETQLVEETGDLAKGSGETFASEGGNEGWGSIGAKDH